MIVMQPVVEIVAHDGFALWPVAEVERFSFLPLSGDLSPAEVGTAMMGIASWNDAGPDGNRPPRPADPLGSFRASTLTATVAAALLFAPSAHATAPGDNGTVKIHDATTGEELRKNEPHVCTF
ncbi:hypothetical protein ABZV53_42660, partial [Streptomyces sp900116325]